MLRHSLIACAILLSAISAQAADAQGSQILEQVIAAAGGRDAYKHAGNFRATGTFSLYSSGEVVESGSADLVGAGLKRFRLTASLGNETRVWLWNDGVGFLSAGNKQTGRIGSHNLSSLEGITLPILKVVALLDGHSSSIQLVEVATVDGREAYRIRVIQTPTDQKERLILGRDSATTNILIDKQTLSIIAIEDTIYPNGHLRESYQHGVEYRDYRAINGAQVPFSIKERISGQATWGLQLNSFSPGESPSSSEFQLN
ncbi:MAG TPA: hypothetical protein VG759_05100 [Candidatus Angelobacter sp.]|jgi:hypothetical protein|nr:hypothetical protein [Candidatus Angelobacter sp.]